MFLKKKSFCSKPMV